MRITEYLERFMGDLDELILDLCDEMDTLVAKRQIATVNGMIALFHEFNTKYRRIATVLEVDPDLFEDVIRATDPQIFRPCGNTTLLYIPVRR